MNRRIELQNCADISFSRMVDAGIAPAAPRETEQHSIPREILERANVRLEYDRFAGWPPKLRGHEQQQCLTASRADVTFDVEAQRRCREAALKHPEVVSNLVGRWETLGIHLVAHKDLACHVDYRARVCFYNYTTRLLVEAFIEDGVVTRVSASDSHAHPEAPIEMAQAIGLARAHPKLRREVENLAAHAILSISTDPAAPGYKHRCLWVMFTERDDVQREAPVLFTALVDLCDQRVIAPGKCSCCPDAGDKRHDHEQ